MYVYIQFINSKKKNLRTACFRKDSLTLKGHNWSNYEKKIKKNNMFDNQIWDLLLLSFQ